MQKHLIVNADDFGYSYSVNKGIITAHTEGIVTSTSVLVDAIAAEEAVGLDKFPNLSVGLHFALQEGQDKQVEFDRQIEKFKAISGRLPEHIDGHKGTMKISGVTEMIQAYAKQQGIPVRSLGYAKFIESFFGGNNNGDLSVAQLKLAIDQATEEYNELMCHAGYSDEYLRGHSSYNDPREDELASICDPAIKQYISKKGLLLCNWKQVPLQ